MSNADKLLSAIHKKFGAESAMTMAGGNVSDVKEVIPTGIWAFDYHVMGIGGLPVGRMGEVYSFEGAGKSSLGFAALAGAQKQGGLAILVETEDALQVERATTFGVDLSEVILLQPGCIEDALTQMDAVLESIPDGVGPNIIVWDSIAASRPKCEIDGDYGDRHVGAMARLLSAACPKLMRKAARKRTALLFINQLREKVGVSFGDNTVTPGGHAVKYAASYRVRMSPGKQVKKGTEVVAKDVTLRTAKNKLRPPFRTCTARLNFEDGWDNEWTTLNYAKDAGVVTASVRATPKGYREALAALQSMDKNAWPGDITFGGDDGTTSED